MTLLTRHLEAGWHEVETNVGKAAERFLNRPGATSSVLRVEAASRGALNDALDLREAQLTGTEAPIKDTITDDGTLVTGDQHAALQVEGVAVAGAVKVTEPLSEEDKRTAQAALDSEQTSALA